MEVKIGVEYSPRELVIETKSSADDIDKQVSEALGAADGLLRLADEKGRTIIVPAAKISYVEYVNTAPRSIGFTA